MKTPPNGSSVTLRYIIQSYIKQLERESLMAKGLLNPRDPDNEIHLVLTPFEASALLRVLVHSSLDSSSSATKPIRQALYTIGVKCATLDEIKKGTLQ